MLKFVRSRQRGMSLVELMVGIAVGMFVVAAASTVVSTQLVDNRKLMLEVQVQQDLRAAADIIARDLRRAGSWGFVNSAAAGVWSISGGPAVANGTSQDVTITGPEGTRSVVYFSSRTTGTPGPYGFRLNGGAIQSQLPGAGWQALTDENTMTVTRFEVTAVDEPPVRAACTKLCADNTESCWPTITVRALKVEITGESKSDGAVKRSVQSMVRLRNDRLSFNVDPTNPNLVCPS